MSSSDSIVIACDHAGLPLKQEIVAALQELGRAFEDLGTHDTASVDYPDYARRASSLIVEGKHRFAVLICGSGVGMAIAANKLPQIRAVVCSEPYSAAMSRRHNDANVLCMGARVVGPGLAREILEAFLGQQFEGGRHQRRVDKLEAC
ncbi:ribose 5-phosphate isomerase B [Sandaracinus amylolyticus]|uniref:Ribose 5-phosphate isomerase B n=1 Tax=Sandaracinus amylolyticus TaxID=927083 RepID=A0A0F6YIJ4_9BACT|nr:ribose 5-phosphate isomerase B [Sandaracinus amylolyticus]AKF06741.1 Ribose 5-phosphate isomerase B [Sandaracinus amylolyticus]